MKFTLDGDDFDCPFGLGNSVGNWEFVGCDQYTQAPFFKLNDKKHEYNHITIPWDANRRLDGLIHYTSRNFPFGSNEVFKYDYAVTMRGTPSRFDREPRSANRLDGRGKYRPVYIFVANDKGTQTMSVGNRPQLVDNWSKKDEWSFTQNFKKIDELVTGFWAALSALQPPIAPPLIARVPAQMPDGHPLYDRTYYGVPSSKPARTIKQFPFYNFESRFKTSLQELEPIARSSQLRIFVIYSMLDEAANKLVVAALNVATELSNMGYRLTVTPKQQDQIKNHEVRIHYA